MELYHLLFNHFHKIIIYQIQIQKVLLIQDIFIFLKLVLLVKVVEYVYILFYLIFFCFFYGKLIFNFVLSFMLHFMVASKIMEMLVMLILKMLVIIIGLIQIILLSYIHKQLLVVLIQVMQMHVGIGGDIITILKLMILNLDIK